MKDIVLFTVSKLPSITCFAGAIYIMSAGITGWGWLIFAGILVSTSFKYKGENEK